MNKTNKLILLITVIACSQADIWAMEETQQPVPAKQSMQEKIQGYLPYAAIVAFPILLACAAKRYFGGNSRAAIQPDQQQASAIPSQPTSELKSEEVSKKSEAQKVDLHEQVAQDPQTVAGKEPVVNTTISSKQTVPTSEASEQDNTTRTASIETRTPQITEPLVQNITRPVMTNTQPQIDKTPDIQVLHSTYQDFEQHVKNGTLTVAFAQNIINDPYLDAYFGTQIKNIYKFILDNADHVNQNHATTHNQIESAGCALFVLRNYGNEHRKMDTEHALLRFNTIFRRQVEYGRENSTTPVLTFKFSNVKAENKTIKAKDIKKG